MMEITLEFDRVDCPNCGMICHFPQNFIQKRKSDYLNFYCGAGHAMSFTDKNRDTPENLKKKVTDLQDEVKRLKTENIQLLHKLDQANVSS
jgi:uncharacterized protein YceH (UPF0502 family)